MNKRHKRRLGAETSEKNHLINDSNTVLSVRRKHSNVSSSSRRFIGSTKRYSVSKLTVSLKDFDINNEEFNCWEYYKSIEKGEINSDESSPLDNSNLESYRKLFNSLYSCILLGTGNCIDDMTKIWDNFMISSSYFSDMGKNNNDVIFRMFFGRLFINIDLEFNSII